MADSERELNDEDWDTRSDIVQRCGTRSNEYSTSWKALANPLENQITGVSLEQDDITLVPGRDVTVGTSRLSKLAGPVADGPKVESQTTFTLPQCDKKPSINRESAMEFMMRSMGQLATTLSQTQEWQRTLTENSMKWEGNKLTADQHEKENKARRRERFLSHLAKIGDKDRLDIAIEGLETHLRHVETPQDEWNYSLYSMLTGRYAELAADLPRGPDTPYCDFKRRLLEAAGYTTSVAALQLWDCKYEEFCNLSPAQWIQRQKRLVLRIVSGCHSIPDVVSKIACASVYAKVGKRGRSYLDARNTSTEESFLDALQGFCTSEGGFPKDDGFPRRQNPAPVHYNNSTCFHCGKVGHRRTECWHFKNQQPPKSIHPSSDQSLLKSIPQSLKEEGQSTVDSSKTVTCYTCGKVGHKTPACPEKTKKVNVMKTSMDIPNTITGSVDGQDLQFTLDTGATISLIPKELVSGENRSFGRVVITDANGGRRERETTKVDIVIAGETYRRDVALAPRAEMDGKGLFAVDLRDSDDCKIVKMFMENVVDERKVNVCTRSEAKALINESIEFQELEQKRQIVSEDAVREENFEEGLSRKEDTHKGCAEDVSENGEEGDKGLEKMMEMPVLSKGKEKEELQQAIREDESLAYCKSLGDRGEKGFKWEDGLLFKEVEDEIRGRIRLLVVPGSKRQKLLELAHEGSAHLGGKKVLHKIAKCFYWPFMAKDVTSHCRSCLTCAHYNKSGQKRAPLQPRPILTEPFEVMALDIIGPLPKTKGGFRYALTAICLATRWPTAVPLKNIKSHTVAQAMMEVFSQTSLPLKILTDQGSQFMGKLCKEVMTILGIDQSRTSPYHPQTNGAVERLNKTLKEALAKQHDAGISWSEALPIVLFHLRQHDHTSTGLSPHQLVYGWEGRSLLDLIHAGWTDKQVQKFDLTAYATQLASTLSTLRDIGASNAMVAQEKRKELYDRNSSQRHLEQGSLVMYRTPGLHASLSESWIGPFEVLECLGAVNYRIKKLEGGKSRVVHVNMLKKYQDREEKVKKLVVVAEDTIVGQSLQIERAPSCPSMKLQELLDRYTHVLSVKPGNTKILEMEIDVMTTSPINLPPYRVPDRLKEEVKKEILQLKADGIIEASTAVWSAPIVPVLKPSGAIRLCVDYRRLNSVTIQQHHYIPELSDILNEVGHSSVLSKLDLAQGFHQIPMAEQSKDITTFVSPFGRWRFIRMPFGLKNAPATFQRAMEKVLAPCEGFASCYIDDVLVYSKDWDEHLLHLENVFKELQRHGLTVKPGKCQFGMAHLEYLGHVVGGGQLAVPEYRIENLKNYKRPETQKDLRSFLGMISYYRQFIPNFAEDSSYLTPATSKSSPRMVQWSLDMEDAFHRLVGKLCHVTILCVPSPTDNLVLHTDASGRGVGAVLSVDRDGQEIPCAFFSRQLRGAERRYSTTEWEALAVVAAVSHFEPILFRRPFKIVTDHKPLVSLMSSRVLNKRLQGWALKLQHFDFVVEYRSGGENSNADAMSRQSWEDEVTLTEKED